MERVRVRGRGEGRSQYEENPESRNRNQIETIALVAVHKVICCLAATGVALWGQGAGGTAGSEVENTHRDKMGHMTAENTKTDPSHPTRKNSKSRLSK